MALYQWAHGTVSGHMALCLWEHGTVSMCTWHFVSGYMALYQWAHGTVSGHMALCQWAHGTVSVGIWHCVNVYMALCHWVHGSKHSEQTRDFNFKDQEVLLTIEDNCTMSLQNTRNHSYNDIMSYSRRLEFYK